MRPGPRRPGRVRHGPDDRALLPLDLRLRHAQGPQARRSQSFDDPALQDARRSACRSIGDDGDEHAAGPRPGARAGIVDNVVGYTRLRRLRASRTRRRGSSRRWPKGEVDVAVVWGPLAGYFAKRAAGAAGARPRSTPAVGPAGPAVRLRHRDGRAQGEQGAAGRARRDPRRGARPRSTRSSTSTACRGCRSRPAAEARGRCMRTRELAADRSPSPSRSPRAGARTGRSGRARARRGAATDQLSELQPGPAAGRPGGEVASVGHVTNGYEENAYALSEGKRLFSAFNCSAATPTAAAAWARR